MLTTGINHIIPLSKKTYLNSSVNFSGLRNIYTEFSRYDTSNPFLRDKDRFYKSSLSASTNLNHKFNSRHFLKAGVIYSYLSFNMLSELYDGNEDELVTEISDKGNSYTLQGFASWNYRINRELTLDAGAHMLYFGLNGDLSVEPRGGIRWQFRKNQSLSAGFGLHSRTEALSIYLANGMNETGSIIPQQNRDLGLMKAWHFVIGYDHFFTQDLYFKAEIYYQQLYNVPYEPGDSSVYSILNQSEWFTTRKLDNGGKGYNYGLEMTLEKYFSKSYYFMVTTSLFNSQYLAGDGEWRNSAFNSGYVLNLLGGKEFKIGKPHKNRSLTISMKGTWTGGHYYTPIDLEASREAQYTVLDESNYLGIKSPDFIRFDLKASIRRDRPKSTHVFELDIQNVTNAQIPVGRYYDIYTNSEIIWTSVGIIPVLNYRIEF
jgi:hypothetical protein